MKNAISLEHYLEDSYTILLEGPIDMALANQIVIKMLYLDARRKAEGIPANEGEITLLINSPGGDVNQGMAIYNVMNMVGCDVRTLGLGMCASMGAFLLSAGTRGKREVLPDCEIMIHQPLGGAQGQAEDIRIHTQRILRTRDRLNTILAGNTGKTVQEIERATDRDHFMTPEEALEFGLIDNIRPSYPKAFFT